MVSRNLRQTHLLEVSLTKIPGDHETLSIVRHVGPHVDFSPSCVYSELDGLCPFDQWELLDCNGHGPSLLCVKWP